MGNKKKLIWKLSLLLCIAALLAGCSVKRSDNPNPQLIIGYDNYRPYSYIDEDGEPDGIDVELAREACRRIGYEPVFKPVSWNESNSYLATGRIDCIWSCVSMEHPYDYAWVGPYMYGRQVVAVLKDSNIGSLEDLRDERMAVKVGSEAESIFVENNDERIPQIGELHSLNDMEEVVSALRNGYVDACAGYAATLTELLNNSGVEYRFLDEDLMRVRLGVVFSKESDDELRNKLETALDEMRSDGTTKKILEKYGLNAEKALGGIAYEKK